MALILLSVNIKFVTYNFFDMSDKPLITTYNLIRRSLQEHRILAAITHLRTMAQCAGASWDVHQNIQTVDDSYGYLKRYAMDGIDDPQRSRMLNDVGREILMIATGILRSSLIPDSPRQYFGVIRFEQLQSDSDLITLLKSYSDLKASLDSKVLLGGRKFINPDEIRGDEKALEELASRIFNVIWTTYPLSLAQQDAIEHVFADTVLPDSFKELILSALMLGCLEYYDERRMLLMSKAYLSQAARLSVKAAVAILLNMWVHRKCDFGDKFRTAMGTIQETNTWREDLKSVFLEFARTRDTERVSRKLSDEIIPEMMKLRPDILKKAGSSVDKSELLSLDENPEWAEMFDKSGLGDKLKELNDIQADGGDVMMSTFSHLKSFPFFNEISNWFLPFTPRHTAITGILGESAPEIAELIAGTPMMCDSDKYSILLSLERIPSESRRMMLEQFKSQSLDLTELANTELNPELSSRKKIINRHIQDIYRFFTLYRRKADFRNPFIEPVNLAAVNLLKPQLDDTDALTVVAEFYFTHGHYPEALDLFDILLNKGDVVAEIYQKRGFCLQKAGRTEEALEMYLGSEMLRPDSLWTLKRIAQCYRLTGNNANAIVYYSKIAERKPNDVSTIINLGHSYLEIEDYDNALKCYYKVDYLVPETEKALRPLAWCLFLKGDFDRSAEYYAKVLMANPSSGDYLNLGHLHMALKRYHDAEKYYKMSLDSSKSSEDMFMNQMRQDRRYLIHAGIDQELLDIVVDSVLAS